MKLTPETLELHRSGGMNICDEWNWNGNYYFYISNYSYDVKHNYQLRLSRRGSIRNSKGWIVDLCISLTAPNSAEISLINTKVKTIKEGKKLICDAINDNDNNVFDKEVVSYASKRIKPVFFIENNEPVFVGHTYGYVSNVFENHRSNESFNYWKEKLNFLFKNQTIYCSISKHFNYQSKQFVIDLECSKKLSCGYCGAKFEIDKNIINNLIINTLIYMRDNKKYNISLKYFVINTKYEKKLKKLETFLEQETYL